MEHQQIVDAIRLCVVGLFWLLVIAGGIYFRKHLGGGRGIADPREVVPAGDVLKTMWVGYAPSPEQSPALAPVASGPGVQAMLGRAIGLLPSESCTVLVTQAGRIGFALEQFQGRPHYFHGLGAVRVEPLRMLGTSGLYGPEALYRFVHESGASIELVLPASAWQHDFVRYASLRR